MALPHSKSLVKIGHRRRLSVVRATLRSTAHLCCPQKPRMMMAKFQPHLSWQNAGRITSLLTQKSSFGSVNSCRIDCEFRNCCCGPLISSKFWKLAQTSWKAIARRPVTTNSLIGQRGSLITPWKIARLFGLPKRRRGRKPTSCRKLRRLRCRFATPAARGLASSLNRKGRPAQCLMRRKF
jgi:hypothetical protein